MSSSSACMLIAKLSVCTVNLATRYFVSKSLTNPFSGRVPDAYTTSSNCRTKRASCEHLRSSSTSDGNTHRRRRWYMQVLIPYPLVRAVNAAASHVCLIYSRPRARSLVESLCLCPSLSLSVCFSWFYRCSVEFC